MVSRMIFDLRTIFFTGTFFFAVCTIILIQHQSRSNLKNQWAVVYCFSFSPFFRPAMSVPWRMADEPGECLLQRSFLHRWCHNADGTLIHDQQVGFGWELNLTFGDFYWGYAHGISTIFLVFFRYFSFTNLLYDEVT